MRRPGLKILRQEGCATYLLWDPESLQALVVDPRTDGVEDYRDAIAAHKLKVELIIDTRLHWHHLSGSLQVSRMYGVPIAMSERTESHRATRKLRDGESLQIGSLVVEVLAAPGSGPDALVLRVGELLLSGDALWIGAPTRVDVAGGDAGEQYRTLQRLAGLPDNTVVLPGYDSQELLFSTLAIELKRNPDLGHASAQAFAQAKEAERPARGSGDGSVRHRLRYNTELTPIESTESHFGGVPLLHAATVAPGGASTIGAQKLADKVRGKQDRSACVLDVREPAEFGALRIAGSINLPLSELPLRWRELAPYKRVYVACQTGRRSQLAAKTLDYLGLGDVVHLSGGLQAWEHAGYPLERD